MKKFCYFTHIYQEVIGVNLKFLMEKLKWNDCDVSTVVLGIFLSQTFSFTREFFKDAKLHLSCGLVKFCRL